MKPTIHAPAPPTPVTVAAPTRALSAQDSGSDPVDGLAEEVAELLADHWRRGFYVRADELFEDYPELRRRPRAAVRVIYEEICQRQELGFPLDLATLGARFPMWRSELERLLDCHRLLEPEQPLAAVPGIGETLGEFRLLGELGKGGLGQVVLAEQSSLAGRLMVLKLTPNAGQEHLKLARLQHTHIVPLYSVRDFPERQLRVLCMPCLGGTTLDRILEQLRAIPPVQRTGRDIRCALDEAVADPRMRFTGRGSLGAFLDRAGYEQAICWLGVCLAEGLQHAHDQGVVHFDIKPSNVLLTADAVPMLLDFHLARAPLTAGAVPETLGGTPGYMAPEQCAAWQARRQRQPLVQGVDARADVYALGMLLIEALSGSFPGADPRAHVQTHLRRLPLGLRDILMRCVQTDPARRYPAAAPLAEDLRRHLNDRRLVGVRNRSLIELWRKWRRREPHVVWLTTLGAVALVAVMALSLGAWYVIGQRQRDAQRALDRGREQLARGAYAEAAASFRTGLDQVESLPGATAPLEPLRHEWQRALRAQAAQELHRQVEKLRYAYGDDSLSSAALREMSVLAAAAWSERHRLTVGLAELPRKLDEQVAVDLLDVAILLSDVRVRSAGPTGTAEARGAALDVLDEAEAMFGPQLVIDRQRQVLTEALRRPPVAPRASGRPRTASDHYQLGRWLLHAGDTTAAAAALEQATAIDPAAFWPWFWRGLCAAKRQRWDEAREAFTVCLALSPDQPAVYFNRGRVLTAMGNIEPARADYDRALELDPSLAAAALNRGMLHYQARHYDQALADVQRAADLGADPGIVHYDLALIHAGRQDIARARSHLERAREQRPDAPEIQQLQEHLRQPRSGSAAAPPK